MCLTFMFRVCFKLILVQSKVRVEIHFFFPIQISNCSSTTTTSFPIDLLCHICQKSKGYISVGLFLESLFYFTDLYISCHTTLIIVTLFHFKSGHLSLTHSFFFKTRQAILVLLFLHKNLSQFVHLYKKACLDFDLDSLASIVQFREK